MLLAAGIAVAVLVLVLAGSIENGYLTRVWRRSSRLARGRRYRG